MNGAASVSVAQVPTHSASRYRQQLAKHWSHKMAVAFSEQEATIPFPSGAILVMRAGSDMLDVVLTVPAAEDRDQMRAFVSRHLDRFAFREAPLTFAWQDG